MLRNSPNCVEGKKNACFHDFRNLLIVFDLRLGPLDEGCNLFRFRTINRSNRPVSMGDSTCLIAKLNVPSHSTLPVKFANPPC